MLFGLETNDERQGEMSDSIKDFPMSEIVTACGPFIARRGFHALYDVYGHLYSEDVTTFGLAMMSKHAEVLLREQVDALPVILNTIVPVARKAWIKVEGDDRRDLVWHLADTLDKQYDLVPIRGLSEAAALDALRRQGSL